MDCIMNQVSVSTIQLDGWVWSGHGQHGQQKRSLAHIKGFFLQFVTP